MTLMIMGAIMIFLATLLGIFLLVLSMPIIFNFITNEIWLEKLFLRFGKENFSFALIKLKDNLMSNLVIYVFFGILITLFFVLVTIVISQIRHRKNYKVAIRLFYTNFALTGIIFTILILMIIFTGIWWFSFILAVLAMGLFFLQNSFLSLIKNSINHKEYQIGNIVTVGAREISNEDHLDINNEIANIRKNNIQAQQSLFLVKEKLHSELLNDKDYETNEIDSNKLVVNSKASLPDILNPMLLKENKDDGEVRKIIAEPIYEEIKTDEVLFSSLVTEEQGVASNEQQQLDSKNNVISSDEQKEADDKNHGDINNQNLQVEQSQYSYVAPSELEYGDVKQPIMSNSVQTGNGEYGCGKQLFTNGYYQGQQYSQVQEQMVALGEQKEADDKNQGDINNQNLQVEQSQYSYVAPSELEYGDVKQPIMSNSVQTGNGEYGCGKQLFTNGYYQGQQYSQVQEQMVALGEQKEADDKNQGDINNQNLQVEQSQYSYVAPSELEYGDVKQPIMSNSVQTGNGEYGCGKQLFTNGYYQGQQYSQVQEQMVALGEQKEADDKNQGDINNQNLQVEQSQYSYVAPSELEYGDVKQPIMSNSVQTSNGEYGCGKQLFTNGYYQGQQYSQVQEQMVALGEQKEADDKNQGDINNQNLQVEQSQYSYVAPSELEYGDVKQPIMSNSVQTGNGEYGCGKQLFTNGYYQGQQYSQVQEQMVALGEQKEADDKNQGDINNQNLQVEQSQYSYVAPSELEYGDVKQPIMSNSVQTGNGEYGCGKQLFTNGYYQGQQYSQVQEQMVALGEQKEADDKNQGDINNQNLQVEQSQYSYVAPSELEYGDVKQPIMSNSVQTGNGEYGCGKQLFTNGYYQGQQYSQVQEQMVALGEQKEADDKNQGDINNQNLQVEQSQYSYVAPSELEYGDVKQPIMSNSVQTGNGEYGCGKQLFASESHQNPNLYVNTVLNNSGNWFNQDDEVDTKIDPNKIYYHSPMTGKTVEIDPQETKKFLFANLPGKPDELESPVYEYNPIEEDKKSKNNKKKNHESRSYGIFDQTMQRQANPVGIQEAVSYPQGYVQARYQTKSNYYEQPALNINLPKQETYNKSVVNQQFDASAIAEHYHSQYPNYIFTNDSCPICYQGS